MGEQNALAAAVGWLSGLLGGTFALTIATIAVASIGLLLLSGRVDIRKAVQVLIGCFILFGAPTIAAGIMDLLSGNGSSPDVSAPPAAPEYAPPTKALNQPYDPYAGAALPKPR